MSYTKTNWQTGDIITANKLNNMEDGIANNSKGGGAKIIDLSDIERQKVSNGMFYPYAGGLTDMDLICSYILSHSEFGTAGNKLVMTATPTHADTADGVMDTVKITLNCLQISRSNGSLVASVDTVMYYPSQHNEYSMSGFLISSSTDK